MKTNTRPRKPLIHIDADAASSLIFFAVVIAVIALVAFGIRSCAVTEEREQDAMNAMARQRAYSIEIHQPKYIEIVYAPVSYTDEKHDKEYFQPEQRYLIDVTRLVRITYSNNNSALKVVYYRDEDRDWTLDKHFPGLSFSEWNDAVNQLQVSPSIEAGETLP